MRLLGGRRRAAIAVSTTSDKTDAMFCSGQAAARVTT